MSDGLDEGMLDVGLWLPKIEPADLAAITLLKHMARTGAAKHMRVFSRIEARGLDLHAVDADGEHEIVLDLKQLPNDAILQGGVKLLNELFVVKQ